MYWELLQAFQNKADTITDTLIVLLVISLPQQAAGDWFRTVMSAQPPSGPNLALVMGPDFPAMTGNLARNLRENRLGVLSAVLTRD
jgi:hypothetical protein